jgi:hypothetical protein
MTKIGSPLPLGHYRVSYNMLAWIQVDTSGSADSGVDSGNELIYFFINPIRHKLSAWSGGVIVGRVHPSKFFEHDELLYN